MHIHLISCEVLRDEFDILIPLCQNKITITYLPQGLHDTPQILNQKLKEAIGELEEKPDYIVLGYGLCSNGVIGINAVDIPIVVPRTDDCIALFLGSAKRYLKLFEEKSGTYWLNSGWIKTAYLPTEENIKKKYDEFLEKYGEDNADFLIENDMAWAKNYHYCGYIKSETDSEENLQVAREMAKYNELDFFTTPGDNRMIKNLIDGGWSDEEFLICPIGHEICASFDEKKFTAKPSTKTEI